MRVILTHIGHVVLLDNFKKNMDFLNTLTTVNVKAILSETKNIDTTSLNTKTIIKKAVMDH